MIPDVAGQLRTLCSHFVNEKEAQLLTDECQFQYQSKTGERDSTNEIIRIHFLHLDKNSKLEKKPAFMKGQLLNVDIPLVSSRDSKTTKLFLMGCHQSDYSSH